MTNIRDRAVYVPRQLHMALLALSKAERKTNDKSTADSVAETILIDALTITHPHVLKFYEEQEELEQAMIKSLTENPTP